MQERGLGATGQRSSVVTLGAAGLGKLSQAEADAAIELALGRGVNHVDVAPSYGNGLAEERLGSWIAGHHRHFFLACKTLQRTQAGAWSELTHSLERLRTNHLDLYQLHAVTDVAELDRCFAPGGAMETLLRAKEEGFARYLGITSHGHLAPAVHLLALERFPFDTVIVPMNFVLWANPEYRRDFLALAAVAARRSVGIIAIKAVAQRPWGDQPRTATTWYQPFTEPDEIGRCVRFVLSQEIVTLASPSDTRLLPLVLDGADTFLPMGAAEQEALVATAGQFDTIFAP